ncbi:MAG: ribonuclease P protein component 4 [Thermoplasmatota archaeon]
MARRRDKSRERDIAAERIRVLMREAESAARAARPDRANRYALLARKLAMKHELGSTREMRGKICRACNGFLAPGVTSRVRLTGGRITTTCLQCGNVRRRPMAARPKP